MALFKCKMCGGNLEVADGSAIAECEYCGTKQTVPKANDEKLQNLFNRANMLRIKNEFDKAEELYEKIIQEDSTQAEAYWGLLLCRYGIEYVDDSVTHQKVPTCHRASFESILSDEDYQAALENADMSQRAIYEEQAEEINRIQKEILSLAQMEEAYDVFICYKETDSVGKRTQDSVIANDIYHQLTLEGFKVFYAAITLEGKLGSAYEPIIFTALHSAKVMLVIGTKPEYFQAVWVKNEWSRYLKIMQKDRSKLLIPCYRDMDAYELPEEFAHLQAQDMSKIGFINDIVRGIKKVAVKDEPRVAVVKETVSNANPEALLQRAFLFLEDKEWRSANGYCEKVLDIDPQNAQAYLGKLMADFKVSKTQDIKELKKSITNDSNYQKVLRFADGALREELIGYAKIIDETIEYDRNKEIYDKAVKLMGEESQRAYSKAIELFKSISGWGDSDIQATNCEVKLSQLKEKEEQEEFESAQRKKKRKKRVFKWIAIVVISLILVVLIIVAGIIFGIVALINNATEKNEAKYSLNNVEIVAIDKEASVENSAWSTEYITVFTYRLTNNCLKDIEQIHGNMVFYNGEKEIASSTVRFQSDVASKETKTMTVEFSGTGETYRLLYSVPFEQLRIEYQVTSIIFEDAVKTYDEDYKVIKQASAGASQGNSGSEAQWLPQWLWNSADKKIYGLC